MTEPESDQTPSHPMMREHVRGIAKTHPAVTYHPDDPARTAIEEAAAEVGLVTVPSEHTQYRRVTGCQTPATAATPQPRPAAADTGELTAAVQANTAAVLALATTIRATAQMLATLLGNAVKPGV